MGSRWAALPTSRSGRVALAGPEPDDGGVPLPGFDPDAPDPALRRSGGGVTPVGRMVVDPAGAGSGDADPGSGVDDWAGDDPSERAPPAAGFAADDEDGVAGFGFDEAGPWDDGPGAAGPGDDGPWDGPGEDGP